MKDYQKFLVGLAVIFGSMFFFNLLVAKSVAFEFNPPCQPLPQCLFRPSPRPSPRVSPRPTPTPSPYCKIESWSCEECQKSPEYGICYKDKRNFCEEEFGCEFKGYHDNDGGREWYCENTCNPGTTPTPQPCTENCGTPPDTQHHDDVVYQGPICTADAPKKPILEFIDSDNGCVTFLVRQTDPYDHGYFKYGYSSDNLEYGIPFLPYGAETIRACGLTPGSHVWGQVCHERNYCGSCSDIVDPVIY